MKISWIQLNPYRDLNSNTGIVIINASLDSNQGQPSGLVLINKSKPNIETCSIASFFLTVFMVKVKVLTIVVFTIHYKNGKKCMHNKSINVCAYLAIQ